MNALKLLILASVTGVAPHAVAAEPPPTIASPMPQATAAAAARPPRAPLATVDDLWAVEFTRDARRHPPSGLSTVEDLWDVRYIRSTRAKPMPSATGGACRNCGMNKAAGAAEKPSKPDTQ
jgi:hypothetical protein